MSSYIFYSLGLNNCFRTAGDFLLKVELWHELEKPENLD